MTHEVSVVKTLDSKEDLHAGARVILQKLSDINPDEVRCMMALVVRGKDDTSAANIHALVLGSDLDIAKMLSALIATTRNGVVQANTPSNPNDEVVH